MNPVLAGIGMLAASMRLGAGMPGRFVLPLSRDPGDEELGIQFVARSRRLRHASQDFQQWDEHEWTEAIVNGGMTDGRGNVDWSQGKRLDATFKSLGGCRADLRRQMPRIKGDIEEVRKVTRHANFNPNDAGRAYRTACRKYVKAGGGQRAKSATEICKIRWHEAESHWDQAVVNYTHYKRLEKRNCPALIAGLPGRRLAR